MEAPAMYITAATGFDLDQAPAIVASIRSIQRSGLSMRRVSARKTGWRVGRRGPRAPLVCPHPANGAGLLPEVWRGRRAHAAGL